MKNIIKKLLQYLGYCAVYCAVTFIAMGMWVKWHIIKAIIYIKYEGYNGASYEILMAFFTTMLWCYFHHEYWHTHVWQKVKKMIKGE